MWSKRPILCVCLLSSTALALAMAGQSYSPATKAPFGPGQSTSTVQGLGTLQKALTEQVQANPIANNAQNGAPRRSLCAL